MKVLHLLQSSHFSGAENVACQIIDMMQNECDVKMVYCSPNGPIKDALFSRNITYIPLKKFSIKEVKRVLREQHPDIIHAHDMRASVLVAGLVKKERIVAHIHNSDFKARRISLKSVAFLLSSIKLSNIIWVSNSCFKSYIFHNKLLNKSKILYNVINVDLICQKVADDSTEYNYDIIYVGRLAEPKNPLKLIRIIKLIKQKKSDVRVGIVGNGDLENITKEAVSKLDLKNNVVFHGFMSNPFKALKSAKVMVMTSDREGLPMVALEAMSMGVPIVSTPTDGMCDIVKNGITGFLESDESSFAEKVLVLLTDSDKREKFSLETLDEFKKINDINHYREVIREIYVKKSLS